MLYTWGCTLGAVHLGLYTWGYDTGCDLVYTWGYDTLPHYPGEERFVNARPLCAVHVCGVASEHHPFNEGGE